MKLQTRVSAIFDRTSSLLAFFGASLVIFIMLAVTLEVTVRQFLGTSVRGLFEVTEYALLYITFSGAAWLLKREGHVKMDLVLNRLRPRAQAMLNGITSILGVFTCFVLTWYGVMVTWEVFRIDYHLEHGVISPPLFPIMVIIPVGSFLLFIQFLRKAYAHMRAWRAL